MKGKNQITNCQPFAVGRGLRDDAASPTYVFAPRQSATAYHHPRIFHQTSPTEAQIRIFATEAINPNCHHFCCVT
jgi:hypothetical protein